MHQFNEIIIATHNQWKLQEISSLLAFLGINVSSLNDFPDLKLPPETGTTYQENAYQKAEWIYKQTGLPSLADDSGLEVHAMGGEPGIHSARYLGDDLSQKTKNAKIISNLKDYSGNDRKSRFVCVMILIVNATSWFGTKGIVNGVIVSEPVGRDGFGYDPIFQPIGYDITFAQMDKSLKNSLSHRGKAINDMIKLINLLK